MHYTSADHLKVQRLGYTHHGIYVGNNQVVHYSGKAQGLLDRTGKISQVSLKEFANGARIQIVPHSKIKFTRSEAVKRARSRVGESAYTVFENNCEHFVYWCLFDRHTSRQVDTATTGVNTAITGALGLGTRGALAGRGGASVMQTLKGAGSVAGGGAVRGLNVVAGAGSIVTDVVMSNTVLKHNDALSDEENRARKAGRWSGRIAGLGSSALAGTAVTSMGATGAAGGAAVTSGLAAIGATVGGGMVAGAAITVAAPAALTAVVGYGVYKFVQ